MLEVVKIHEDARGELFEVRLGGRQVGLFASTRAGFARGGHYHKSRQELYVIKGSFEFRTMQSGKPETEKTAIIRQGSFFVIPPDLAHVMIAKEDSVFVESMRGGYESTNYAPYRRLVEERMKSGSRKKTG